MPTPPPARHPNYSDAAVQTNAPEPEPRTSRYLRACSGSAWLTIDLNRSPPTLIALAPYDPQRYPSTWPRPASNIRRHLEESLCQPRELAISHAPCPPRAPLSPATVSTISSLPNSEPEPEDILDIDDPTYGYDV